MSDWENFVDKNIDSLVNQIHRLQIRYYYDIEINLDTLEKGRINKDDYYEYFIGKGRILKEPESDRNNNIRTDLWSYATKIAIQNTCLSKIGTELKKKYPKHDLKKVKWIKINGLHLDCSKINGKKVYSCTIKSISFVNHSSDIRQSFVRYSSSHVKISKDKISKEELKESFVKEKVSFETLSDDELKELNY